MNWDKYFFDLCNTIATNSKCLSRKLGSVIVFDKSIISTGYNGPARGIPSCSERYKLDEYYISKLKEKSGKDPKKDNITQAMETILQETCPRYVLGYKSGQGLDLCVAGHAERNAIVNAARHGIAVKGAIMYMNCPISCKDCFTEIINSGIDEIVCTKLEYYDEVTKYIVKESKINVREYRM